MTNKSIALLTVILTMSGCHNFDTDFPDYDYTAGYFPYQSPVRTLVLGNDMYPNDNDNAGRFVISAAMGGVYKNTRDRIINFKVDESLCENVAFENGDKIKALPKSYYSLSDDSKIVIKNGEYNGGVTVQLTDEFFNDPDAIKNTYVVPLVMTGTSDLDSLIVGRALFTNADRRFVNQWSVAPKDFTMFGIKYITELHGNWFRYGSASITMKDGTKESVEYKVPDDFNHDVTSNEHVMLTTIGRHKSTMTEKLKGTLLNLTPTIIFTHDGENVTISAPAGVSYKVSGTGTYRIDTTSSYNRWSNKDRYVISCSYTIEDAVGNVYKADDFLVARDRAVTLETYTPVEL